MFSPENRTLIDLTIVNPAEALNTGISNQSGVNYASTAPALAIHTASFNANTVFDGFSVLASTGNINGFVTILGIKQ